MKKLVFICIIILMSHTGFGQSKNFYSLSFSPGFAFPEFNESLFYGNAAVHFRHNDYLFSADIENMSSLLTGTYNHNLIGVFGGISKGNKLARYDVQLGLNYIWRELHGWDELTQTDYTYIKDGVGLCLKGGMKIIPFRFIAIGINAKLGYNTYINAYFIPMVTLELGKIR